MEELKRSLDKQTASMGPCSLLDRVDPKALAGSDALLLLLLLLSLLSLLLLCA